MHEHGAVDIQGNQRVGNVVWYRHQVRNLTCDDGRASGSQEPATHDEAHQTLRDQLRNHRQAQTGDHQFTDGLQRIAQDQPVNRNDTRVGREFRPQRQHQECARAQHHTDSEFVRHRQTVAHLVIDSGQNRATNHDPERVQGLILLRLERDTEDGVLNVADSEEVQRRWHLAVQNEEDDCFQHQNERHNHLTTCRTLHREGFFREDNHDTQRNHAQYGTCNALVMQQPGGDSGQDHDADDGCQQFAHVHGFEVWF